MTTCGQLRSVEKHLSTNENELFRQRKERTEVTPPRALNAPGERQEQNYGMFLFPSARDLSRSFSTFWVPMQMCVSVLFQIRMWGTLRHCSCLVPECCKKKKKEIINMTMIVTAGNQAFTVVNILINLVALCIPRGVPHNKAFN